MTPNKDADKIRHGRLCLDGQNEQPTYSVKSSLNELKPNEVCINGVIYDLAGFDHPGGDSIHVFGGNDVSVQYKMIHPHHGSSNDNKHLKKLTCTGTVSDYKPV